MTDSRQPSMSSAGPAAPSAARQAWSHTVVAVQYRLADVVVRPRLGGALSSVLLAGVAYEPAVVQIQVLADLTRRRSLPPGGVTAPRRTGRFRRHSRALGRCRAGAAGRGSAAKFEASGPQTVGSIRRSRPSTKARRHHGVGTRALIQPGRAMPRVRASR
jgi:hypothetical protein